MIILEKWKEAVSFTVKVYKITEDNKFTKDYALKEQIRKSAISIFKYCRRFRKAE
ncbi:MAG: four helix bundle protein [Candidatus Omnitrophica bacterium]|nr:four helix bundle protein [Candidatus Omnitrophota bacterium]